jgi:Tfp pilus assembly protein PilW
MNRALRNDDGFTTVELLGASLCATMILAALYGFSSQQLANLLVQETKTAILEDARGALDIMARELKNAGSWGEGAAPSECKRIVTATPTFLRIQADLNGDGDCDGAASTVETGEDVTYELNKPTDACPGFVIIRRNGNCLVANVVISSKEPLFTYFDANDLQLPGYPSVEAVRRVSIKFSVEVPDPTSQGKRSGKTLKSTLSSSVKFRNS